MSDQHDSHGHHEHHVESPNHWTFRALIRVSVMVLMYAAALNCFWSGNFVGFFMFCMLASALGKFADKLT